MLDLEDEYASIQKIIDDNKENSGFEFRSKVAELASGDAKFSFQTIGEQFVAGIRAEAGTGKKNVTFLIAAGLAGGMLGALSKLFLNRQAAAMGFYMLYLLLFSVLSAAFTELVTLAGTVFSMLLQFMKVLLPAYFLAIAFCTGTRTSYVFYETMVIIITVLEIFIMNIILPAIRIYFVLGMVHHLSEKPFAGSILELLEKGIRGSIKIVFLIVISIQGIEGMLAPFADAAAKSVILKTVGAIPGIGTGIAGVAESILKSGMLLKNAIGIAGVLGIVFLCAYPIGKMVFYTLLYHFSAAAVEAVAEPGVLGCISCSARAAGLLLYTVCTGVLLFMLTIGITLASTNI
jgi:stage III sporulation protein AE